MDYSSTFTSPNLFIGISGIIGVGKSTLTTNLAEQLDFLPFYEPIDDNEYLPLFYEDMEKYGFSFQVYLLNKRFKQHQQAVWCNKGVIQDRTIYEDVIFAKMLNEAKLISDLDFTTYKDLFLNMSNFLHRPNFIIYLDTEPEVALKRIQSRDRGCESKMTLEYLQSLKAGYEDWLKDVEKRIPVIRLDWNEFRSTEFVIEKIKEHLI